MVVELRVPQPVHDLIWRQLRVSADIAPFLVNLDFRDNIHGEADELSITLEDSQGIWSGDKADFYPKYGDDLGLSVGYDSGPLQGLWGCGTFVVDEIKLHGPPDQLTLRALSATGKKPLRQRGSKTWQKVKLKEVMEATAKRMGMTLVGVMPDVVLDEVTRDRETGLGFMTRLAEEWGCVLKAKGDAEIIVSDLDRLLSGQVYATITRSDAVSYDITEKITNTPRDAVARVWDASKKDRVLHTLKRRGAIPISKKPVPSNTTIGPAGSQLQGPNSEDVAVIFTEGMTAAQAEVEKTTRMLHVGLRSAEASVTIQGDPRLRAGMVIRLEGFGKPSGKFFCVRAIHHMDRGGGYQTTLDLMRNPKA